jgi:hypothetical protein
MATTKKKKKKTTVGTNVRLTEEGYGVIKEHCKSNGLVIGRFVEKATLAEVERENANQYKV